jgi:hypothetical protein
MAKTASQPAGKSRAKGRGGAKKPSGAVRGFVATVAGLAALVMALAALPLVLIVAAGMMPTAAAAMVDRQPRYLTFTVGAMNFAGVFPFVLIVAQDNMSMFAAAAKLADPLTWLVMYGAAAAGWVLCGMTPMMARAGIELQAFTRRRTLEALSKAIREEWGAEVAGEKDR